MIQNRTPQRRRTTGPRPNELGRALGRIALVVSALFGVYTGCLKGPGRSEQALSDGGSGGSGEAGWVGDCGGGGEGSQGADDGGHGGSDGGGHGGDGDGGGEGGSAADAGQGGWGNFGGEAGNVGDCGAGGEGGDGDPGDPPCPSSPPADGAACFGTSAGTRCGYDPPGLENRPPLCASCNCRDVFECDGAAWSLTPPDENCDVPEPACPDAAPTQRSACAETGLLCRYGASLCRCVPENLGWDSDAGTELCASAPSWHCSEPAAGCPRLAPELGEACAATTALCVYHPADCCGPVREETFIGCNGGVWDISGGGECSPE